MRFVLMTLCLLGLGCTSPPAPPSAFCGSTELPDAPDVSQMDSLGERWNRREDILTYCLRREAYRLAPANASADLVARAVAEQCADDAEAAAISWAALAKTNTTFDAAVSRDLPAAAAWYARSQRRALFYTLQARAGNCSAK